MYQNKVKKSAWLLPLLLLVSSLAMGQVYKWVDEQGDVHFGDRPPEQTQTEEITIPEGPSGKEIEASEKEIRRAIELRGNREELSAQKQIEEQKEISRRAEEDQRFTRCVAALEQVAVLEYQVRVFKLQPDWTREYLENENRQAEISRLSELAEAHCDADPDFRKLQKEGAIELSKRLNITCITPREKIGKMGKPTTRSEKEKIGEYQDFLDKNCPEVSYQDMWIADWIFFN